MANWAYTNYVIEGPKETLEKVYEAILHPILENGASEGWEGGVLKALGVELDEKTYLRGFIEEETVELTGSILVFNAEEAWGATNFHSELEKVFPDIKVYYNVEETMGEVYATNDKKGKYFSSRFYADCCIDGEYYSEYFVHKSDMFKWLYKITNGKVNTMEKVEEFNERYEDSNADEDNFINIYECSVVD